MNTISLIMSAFDQPNSHYQNTLAVLADAYADEGLEDEEYAVRWMLLTNRIPYQGLYENHVYFTYGHNEALMTNNHILPLKSELTNWGFEHGSCSGMVLFAINYLRHMDLDDLAEQYLKSRAITDQDRLRVKAAMPPIGEFL